MKPLLYPAIDLLEGRAVRLHRGERSSAKVYAQDAAAQAREFVRQGARALHVVDLDAAFGEQRQQALIGRIAAAVRPVPVQVGGGIRDLATAAETLRAGAARVIFGTAAVDRPRLVGEAVEALGADAIACAIDVKDGRVATRGWTQARGPAPIELAAQLAAAGGRWLVVTAVARDGTMEGFDVALLRAVADAAPQAHLIASGGAGALSDLRALKAAGIPSLAGAVAGTALYERRFSIADAQAALDGGAAC